MDKLLSLLGIARRAGKLALGCEPVLESLRRREAKLLLAAGDLSPRTRERVLEKRKTEEIPCLETAVTMDELAVALGKRVGILSVNDAGFAKAMERLWDDRTDNRAQKAYKEETRWQ